MGLCHRDLKVDNIMVDESFRMKIVDFGFSTIIKKNNDLKLTTPLGTETYMAPEIILRQPYKGTEVDVFAMGVVLFTLLSGHIPFHSAKKSDKRYSLIMNGDTISFWKMHSKGKIPNFYSKSFMSIIDGMLCFDPTKRLTID